MWLGCGCRSALLVCSLTLQLAGKVLTVPCAPPSPRTQSPSRFDAMPSQSSAGEITEVGRIRRALEALLQLAEARRTSSLTNFAWKRSCRTALELPGRSALELRYHSSGFTARYKLDELAALISMASRHRYRLGRASTIRSIITIQPIAGRKASCSELPAFDPPSTWPPRVEPKFMCHQSSMVSLAENLASCRMQPC